jgi:hypothetical protein
MRESQGPVVLVYRPKKMNSLERSIALTLLLFVLAIAAYAIRWEDFGAIAKDPVFLTAVVVGLAGPAIIPWQMRRSRIHVDGLGMQQRSSWPVAGEIVERKVAWDHVRSITYAADTGILVVRSAFGLPWAIRAKDWAIESRGDSGGGPHLVALLQDMGVMERKPAAPPAAAQFDLMSDRRTRLVVIAGAIVGFYALLDRFMQTESWAFFDAEYVAPHVVVGIVFAIATFRWLGKTSGRGALDRNLVIGLAIFAAMVATPASYVAGIRVNQGLGGELVAHDYHRAADCLNLVPVEPELPVIEYTDMARGYWCQVPQAKPVPVLVRRGLFGLYQVNLEAQTDAIRRFRDGG